MQKELILSGWLANAYEKVDAIPLWLFIAIIIVSVSSLFLLPKKKKCRKCGATDFRPAENAEEVIISNALASYRPMDMGGVPSSFSPPIPMICFFCGEPR